MTIFLPVRTINRIKQGGVYKKKEKKTIKKQENIAPYTPGNYHRYFSMPEFLGHEVRDVGQDCVRR